MVWSQVQDIVISQAGKICENTDITAASNQSDAGELLDSTCWGGGGTDDGTGRDWTRTDRHLPFALEVNFKTQAAF